MQSRGSLSLFPGIVALWVLSFTGCNEVKLNSTWRDREITVDGVRADWQDAMTYVEKADVAIGLLNDEQYVYVCLAPADRRMAFQMVALGLTVWFDSAGGKGKTFGIHFPLGMEEGGNPLMLREAMQDPKRYQSMLEEMGDELDIFGPGKGQRVRLSTPSTQGIEVKLGHSEGRLIYELKVPLARNAEHPYAIGADTGETIGIGFETAELDREKMRQSMGGRGGGMGRMPPGGGGRGGMGPGGGGMGGRGGRGGMRPGGGMPEAFKLWAKAALASEEVLSQGGIPE